MCCSINGVLQAKSVFFRGISKVAALFRANLRWPSHPRVSAVRIVFADGFGVN